MPERVELRRHITLPEDASARSSHLCLLLLQVDVPQLHQASAVSPGTNVHADLTKILSDVEGRSMWELCVNLAHH